MTKPMETALQKALKMHFPIRGAVYPLLASTQRIRLHPRSLRLDPYGVTVTEMETKPASARKNSDDSRQVLKTDIHILPYILHIKKLKLKN
jgi:hypothetical protein